MDENVLTINKAFAKNYDRYRQKEELQKLKDKYGDVSDESSSSETEDDDAEELTEQVEKDWLRAFSAVKSKDPKIYKKNVSFYHSDSAAETSHQKSRKRETKKKGKPVTLKDYERKVILEKGGLLSDEEDFTANGNNSGLGYFEEQEEIKQSIKLALVDSDDSDTDLLKHRPKTQEEKAEEEEDYREWLKGQREDLQEEGEQFGQELRSLKEYWTDPQLDDGEKFLRDYILNKGYLDKDKDRIPTYEEIVDEAGFSSEEEILQKQEEFETKYNFRYEEPDPDFIKRYPRTISESVRRTENKRAKKRSDIKDRKEMEKQKKREELKQLKNLKRREIMDKMDRLREITGNPALSMEPEDLEGDFDPQQYDQLMQKVFDSDYYGNQDEEKPVFSDDDDLELEENWDNWQGGDNFGDQFEGETSGPHVDDPDFNMDADYNPNAAVTKPKKEGKKQKKRSKFAQAVYKSKPVFDPSEKSFEKYFDEYYKLDYEDIIDDLPCRFKYRKTAPMDYGLSVQEILTADDKELNSWCSVKKMSQYRGEDEEFSDLKKYRRKAKKKYNVLTSLRTREPSSTVTAGEGEDRLVDSSEGVSGVKTTHPRPVETVTSDPSQTDTTASDTGLEFSEEASTTSVQDVAKRKRKKKQRNANSEETTDSSNSVSTECGLRPVDADNIDTLNTSTFGEVKKVLHTTGDVDESPKKKKKKQLEQEHHKMNHSDSVNDNVNESNVTKDTGKLHIKSKMVKGGTGTSKYQNRKTNSGDKKRKRKKKHKPIISDERLKAYGINPKRFKQMQKQSKQS